MWVQRPWGKTKAPPDCTCFVINLASKGDQRTGSIAAAYKTGELTKTLETMLQVSICFTYSTGLTFFGLLADVKS